MKLNLSSFNLYSDSVKVFSFYHFFLKQFKTENYFEFQFFA
jgi:hypothetical protein